MDKIVVCPECGAQMTLQDGQVVFSCVDCGTRLYCIKGVVITKSQAKLLLKKLVEKKQAEKARQLEIERISAENVNETVRPEPPMPMQPVAPVQVKMPEPEQKINIAPPIAPAPKPVEKPVQKPEEKAEAAQIGKVNHTVKSGMAFAIFTYVFFTAFMFAWFYPLHKMSLSFVNALPSVANDELLKTIVGYVWIYFDLLVFLAWVCASSSFMSLGCVRRRKIDGGGTYRLGLHDTESPQRISYADFKREPQKNHKVQTQRIRRKIQYPQGLRPDNCRSGNSDACSRRIFPLHSGKPVFLREHAGFLKLRENYHRRCVNNAHTVYGGRNIFVKAYQDYGKTSLTRHNTKKIVRGSPYVFLCFLY